jgi:DNA-binding transcriptional LysR family regulator
MELRHLRYFVAVGEEQHYGRAAERLRVAQPALSRQIQDLEEEVGFKLFDRLPRGVKINAAGKSLLNDARRILQEVHYATARAKRIAAGQSGHTEARIRSKLILARGRSGIAEAFSGTPTIESDHK